MNLSTLDIEVLSEGPRGRQRHGTHTGLYAAFRAALKVDPSLPVRLRDPRTNSTLIQRHFHPVPGARNGETQSTWVIGTLLSAHEQDVNASV